MSALDQTESKVTFCRFCHALCGIVVEMQNGRPVKVTGDKQHPMTKGFTCRKGRSLPEQQSGPQRLLKCQQRQPDGTFAAVAYQHAITDIADRLSAVRKKYGPRAIALYHGNGADYVAQNMANALWNAMCSPMRFHPGTIDQPGKPIAKALVGGWSAGHYSWDEADSWLIAGCNPVVSLNVSNIPPFNPAQRLKDARKRGMKLVVVDPRKTETAEAADVHLQSKPGEDATVFAGLLRIILSEGLHDKAFVAEEVKNLSALRAALEPFTPAYVAARAEIPVETLIEAARIYAAGRKGCATAGTGTNMAAHGKLSEYLLGCLMTVCGHFRKAGEPVPNPGVLGRPAEFRAQAIPEAPSHGFGEKMRVRGLEQSVQGLPVSGLAEEILLPGKGQVKALICVAGNPARSWPDQRLTVEALTSLDLLVTVDIRMSDTAKLSDYVIAAKHSLETESTNQFYDELKDYGLSTSGYPEPFGQWTPAVAFPPDGADVVADWEFFYDIADKMGLPIEFGGFSTDKKQVTPPTRLTGKPTDHELLAILAHDSRIPFAEVVKHPHGNLFPFPATKVLRKQEGWKHRLNVGSDLMMAELETVSAEPVTNHGGYRHTDRYTHRMVCRRMRNVFNSEGHELQSLNEGGACNPLYMCPSDMADRGFQDGDIIEIDSGHGRIQAVLETDAGLRPGAVSISHSFGGLPEERADVNRYGSNTNLLIDVAEDFDPVSGMPRMSALPVNLEKVATEG